MVQSSELREPKELLDAYGARYLPTGHIVYLEGSILFAIPFDLNKFEVTGGKVPLVEGVRNVAISNSGTLIFVPGRAGATTQGRTLVWVDRNGKEEPIAAEANSYMYPRISPDGTRLARRLLDRTVVPSSAFHF